MKTVIKSIRVLAFFILITNIFASPPYPFAIASSYAAEEDFSDIEEMDKRIKDTQKMLERDEKLEELQSKWNTLFLVLGMLIFAIAILIPLKKLIHHSLKLIKLERGPNVDIPDDVPPDIRKLIKKLYSSHEEKRWEAVYDLGAMGKRAYPAIPFLIDMLKRKYAHSEKVVIDKSRPKEDIPLGRYAIAPVTTTMKAINDADSAMKSIQTPETIPIVSVIVTNSLASIGTPAVKALIVLLTEGDRHDRKAAADALAKIGDTRAAEPLTEALKDEDEAVRESAKKALDKINGASVSEESKVTPNREDI